MKFRNLFKNMREYALVEEYIKKSRPYIEKVVLDDSLSMKTLAYSRSFKDQDACHMRLVALYRYYTNDIAELLYTKDPDPLILKEILKGFYTLISGLKMTDLKEEGEAIVYKRLIAHIRQVIEEIETRLDSIELNKV